MKSADSGKLAEAAQDLVRWISDQALDGIGPLPSSSELAEQYRHQPYANDGSLAASLAIQAPMVGAIAEIYGHDSRDDRVRTAILLCMKLE